MSSDCFIFFTVKLFWSHSQISMGYIQWLRLWSSTISLHLWTLLLNKVLKILSTLQHITTKFLRSRNWFTAVSIFLNYSKGSVLLEECQNSYSISILPCRIKKDKSFLRSPFLAIETQFLCNLVLLPNTRSGISQLHSTRVYFG